MKKQRFSIFSKISLVLIFILEFSCVAMSNSSSFFASTSDFSANGKYLYMVSQASNSILIVDTETKIKKYHTINNVIDKITGLALSKDNQNLLVTTYDDGGQSNSAIYIFSLNQGVFSQTLISPQDTCKLNGNQRPMSLTMHMDGNRFFFVDANPGGQIYQYDQTTKKLISFGPANSKQLMGLAIKSSGDRLYVSDFQKKEIYVFDISNSGIVPQQVSNATISTLKEPYQLVHVGDNLYVRSGTWTLPMSNTIDKYTFNGETVKDIKSLTNMDAQQMDPNNRLEPMMVSPDNYFLYAAFYDTKALMTKIFAIDMQGGSKWEISTALTNVDSLRIQPNGNRAEKMFCSFSGDGGWAVIEKDALGYGPDPNADFSIIDDFEGIVVQDSDRNVDSTSVSSPVITIKNKQSPNSTNMLEVKYRWTGTSDNDKATNWGGSWSGKFAKIKDATSYDAVTFMLKGDGSNNSIRLQFMDDNEPVFYSPKISLKDTEWKTYIIPCSAFTYYKNNIETPVTGSTFWDKLDYYHVIYDNADNVDHGSHYFEDVRFIKTTVLPKDVKHNLKIKALLGGFYSNNKQVPTSVILEFYDAAIQKIAVSPSIFLDENGEGTFIIGEYDDIATKIIDKSLKIGLRHQIPGAVVLDSNKNKPNHLGVILKDAKTLGDKSSSEIDLQTVAIDDDNGSLKDPLYIDSTTNNKFLWGGDANGDGKISVTDIAVISKDLGQTYYNPGADIDGNGKISTLDISMSSKNFGKVHNSIFKK